MYFFSIFGPQVRDPNNNQQTPTLNVEQNEETINFEYITNLIRRVFNLQPESLNSDRLTIEDLYKNTELSLYTDCESQELCSICHEPLQSYQIVRTIIKCKHSFHQKCVDNWLIDKNNCPMCREIISSSSFTRRPEEEEDILRIPINFQFEL